MSLLEPAQIKPTLLRNAAIAVACLSLGIAIGRWTFVPAAPEPSVNAAPPFHSPTTPTSS